MSTCHEPTHETAGATTAVAEAPEGAAVVPTAYSLATPGEITAVREALEAAGLFPETARIAYLGLVDPERGTASDAETDRRFRVFLLEDPMRLVIDVQTAP